MEEKRWKRIWYFYSAGYSFASMNCPIDREHPEGAVKSRISFAALARLHTAIVLTLRYSSAVASYCARLRGQPQTCAIKSATRLAMISSPS